ncbi:MAG: TatD family hydrolase [Candidatus Pacebacteria bacterium]|nr:TatD family hydrolase [Candidatus Paceibacterota bacterium]MCF7862633.1 TatD family hydrolase [Candidatus Paceibacterota bacterium]
MKYIDIHSHVNFKAFDEDRDAVIKRALDADTWVINVGTQIDTSKKAVEMAHQYETGVYAIIGLHPIHTGASYHDEKELGEGGKEFTSRGEIFDMEAYRILLEDPKTVGIGECGLDYFHLEKDSIQKQKDAFISQIQLANEVGKPIMLHIRNNKEDQSVNAYKDALQILKEYAKVKGDVHFFAGSVEEAKAFVDFGFTISFTGVITFTKDYDEVIKNIPIEMIMTETDAPYVAPVPYRGKRNEPSYVKEVVKKIAEVKGLSEKETARILFQNAKRVWGV